MRCSERAIPRPELQWATRPSWHQWPPLTGGRGAPEPYFSSLRFTGQPDCWPRHERATGRPAALHLHLAADPLLVPLQGSPAAGSQPPVGRSSAGVGASVCSAGRRGSPSASAWRPAGPATCPCAAPMGSSTRTTVSSTGPPACWARRSSSSTARTVSSKVGRRLSSLCFGVCDGSLLTGMLVYRSQL